MAADTAFFDDLRQRINGYSIGNTPYTTTLEELEPHKSTILDDFKAWAPSPERCIEQFESNHAYSAIALAVASLATDLPDWFLPYLAMTTYNIRENANEARIKAFEGQDDSFIAEAIRSTVETDYFSQQSAVSILPCIRDQQVFAQTLRFAMEQLSSKELAPLLKHDIERAIPIVKDAYDEEKEPPTLVLWLLLSNMRQHSDDDAAYLEGLGHKIKSIRELAQLGVSNQGAKARKLLEQGVKARRKAVREWCSTQLEVIGEDEDESNTSSSANTFEQLDEKEQEAITTRIDDLYQKDRKHWKKWVDKEVIQDPLLWMHATLSLLGENPDFIHRWAILSFLLTHDKTKPQHQPMWAAYLHHLARNPRIKSSHTQWHLKKHFELIPAEYEQEVLDHALLGANAPMTVPMLEHYFAVRLCSPKILELSITHKSKKVRDAAVKGASFWPEDADATPIIKLLGARKKDTRLYAAECLFKMPLSVVSPHIEALQAHADKEKVDEVTSALEAVIARK